MPAADMILNFLIFAFTLALLVKFARKEGRWTDLYADRNGSDLPWNDGAAKCMNQSTGRLFQKTSAIIMR
jgi:hypothetical protein